jgi:hypothetical protein
MNRELIIPISGHPDLKVRLREPLPVGTKLIDVIDSRVDCCDDVSIAGANLGITPWINKAREHCQHALITSRESVAIVIPFVSLSGPRCGGFVFSHSKGKLYEHVFLFEYALENQNAMKRLMRSFLTAFTDMWISELMDPVERLNFRPETDRIIGHGVPGDS